MASFRPQCLICNEAGGKYKCTKCNLYTCSLPCFQEHRDNHPPIESSTIQQPRDTPAASIGDDKSHNESQDSSHAQEKSAQPTNYKRSGIADMPEYKALVQKYPNLNSVLWNIAAATDPPANNGSSNAGRGPPRSYKGYQKENQPWTQDKGYENARDVLRQTREAPGDDRDALKEYCELVKLYKARIESAEAEAIIRQQLAKDDAKAIAELLRAEKSDKS
ncbi:hypothetical protein F4819DRAFT_400115 [Hypoxylon fuscum]|nr:hypothetical protein F4819DRAFT_400115 [Hypoxylon fuscum]